MNAKTTEIYEAVTARIIAKLEAGTVPWIKPWSGGGIRFNHRNSAGKLYSGINAILLAIAGEKYSSSRWYTYKGAQAAGGQVRKGERATQIVFWNVIEIKSETSSDGEISTRDRSIPYIKMFSVFNAEQCDGLPESEAAPARVHDPIESCEKVVRECAFSDIIKHDGADRNYYRPSTDSIHLVKPEKFSGAEEYYGTCFHEMIHATGHASRLNRDLPSAIAARGGDDYSREELVAELGSAFLCEHCGIETSAMEVNQAAYIASWIQVLKNDPKAIIWAAGRAQKAADYILGTPAD